MKPQPIRDAEWSIQFLDGLQAQPQPGRIRRFIVGAVEIAACAALVVVAFYGLLFLTLLGA